MRVDALVAFLVGLATGDLRRPTHTVVELDEPNPFIATFTAGPLDSGRVRVAVRHHGLLILHVWDPPQHLRHVA